jgi:hypothetical protein
LGLDIVGKNIGIADAVVINSKNVSVFIIFTRHKNQLRNLSFFIFALYLLHGECIPVEIVGPFYFVINITVIFPLDNMLVVC